MKKENQDHGIKTAWIVTDGKMGDIAQTMGVTDALGLEPEVRKIAPRPPFNWLAPWGPVDPRESEKVAGSPLAPPFPDFIIASGRRTVPYVRRIMRLSPKTFTAFMKDPRTGVGAAHLIWVPEHDPLRGENVFVTLTSPHRCSEERLAEARARAEYILPQFTEETVALLLGGNSVNHSWPEGVITDFTHRLEKLVEAGKARGGLSFLVTPSRRTPPELLNKVKDALATTPHYIWDGAGENPYLAMLATADHFIVTADSVNMIGEALVSGKPVHVFEPEGGHAKFTHFLTRLKGEGYIHELDGALVEANYQPFDATLDIAAEIARRYALFKKAHG